jgi:two-component system response regulator AtoC
MSSPETRSTQRKAGTTTGDLWLVVSSEQGLSSMRLPQRDAVVIGREQGCDVVIDDPSVSRRHAVIESGAVIRDLDSRNGTAVGGVRLQHGERAPLGVGSVVELGTVTFVLVDSKPKRGIENGPPSSCVVCDPTMLRLYALLDVIAPSELPVLVFGETGTGKEIFAETIHARSRRAASPLLRINCAGLTGSLLEAELFGYERGAFTGATTAKPGFFEAADGGTMFLDEIGELPLETQAKLLRVLESGDVYRLGSVKPRKVDVRYIAATHRDLSKAVATGAFRQDLLFRLNGFELTLPPLRQRPSEVLPLARTILAYCAARAATPSPQLSAEASRTLTAHSFPGNIRELKHIVERAFVLARGAHQIDVEHLMLGAGASPASRRLARTFDVTREEIDDALRQTGGNQTRAAELLGIARRTLINRMETFGMDRPRKK